MRTNLVRLAISISLILYILLCIAFYGLCLWAIVSAVHFIFLIATTASPIYPEWNLIVKILKALASFG